MESENNRTEEILEESQEGPQEGPQEGGQTFLPSGVLKGDTTSIQRISTSGPTIGQGVGGVIPLNSVVLTVNRFTNLFYKYLADYPDFLVGSGGNEESIDNRPLFLKDLLDLLDPTSEISKVFNAIPIAQFKHLPDISVLNTNPINGGQYNLPTNELNEESLETPEVMPSLEVEEPVTSGGARSHKWSSHKKRRHTRIRTKKNKKL